METLAKNCKILKIVFNSVSDSIAEADAHKVRREGRASLRMHRWLAKISAIGLVQLLDIKSVLSHLLAQSTVIKYIPFGGSRSGQIPD